jgi:hypothetical protein
MNNFFKEFADDLLAIDVNVDRKELGIRIGSPILRHAFDKLPTYKIRDTNYNRQKLKFFKYEGINVKGRELKFYSRLRIQNFTDKIWPGTGTWCTYDNSWDIQSGLSLEVVNRTIKGNVAIHDTNSDWPSGLGGIFFTAFDAAFGSLSWIFTGKFKTLSDIVGVVGGLIFNVTDTGNITSFLGEIDNLNQRGLIYLNRTDYDPKGFWMWHAIDPGRIDEALQRIDEQLKSRGWL